MAKKTRATRNAPRHTQNKTARPLSPRRVREFAPQSFFAQTQIGDRLRDIFQHRILRVQPQFHIRPRQFLAPIRRKFRIRNSQFGISLLVSRLSFLVSRLSLLVSRLSLLASRFSLSAFSIPNTLDTARPSHTACRNSA